jgi:cation transporter-like permease
MNEDVRGRPSTDGNRWIMHGPILALPAIAGAIYHVWLRQWPQAAFMDSLIPVFLFLLLIQAAGVPLAYYIGHRHKEKEISWFFISLIVFYFLMTFYSILYAIGMAVSAI